MRDGVKVSMMSFPKLSNEQNPDDNNGKVSVALLSVSRMCNETEPGFSSCQDIGAVTIAKPVTGLPIPNNTQILLEVRH